MTKIYETADVAFKKLSPKDGDTMVISFPQDIAHEQMEAFAQSLNDMIPKGVTVLCLREGMTVELLSEEAMNGIGWHKMGTIQ